MQAYTIHKNSQTPFVIKLLIWLTASVSILSPVFSFLLSYFFKMAGPVGYLSLNHFFFEGFFWQPLTYFFLSITSIHLSLFHLLSLAFLLALLWFTGISVIERIGSTRFLLFYLGAGLFAGLISSIFLFFSPHASLAGCSPPIFALLCFWVFACPELEFSFFFFFRLKGKILAFIILGLGLLSDLSQGSIISLIADIAGIAWGAFFGSFLKTSRLQKRFKNQKIVDIEEIKEADDVFMDRMLDKLFKKGSSSLSKTEKKRMDEISKKRKS